MSCRPALPDHVSVHILPVGRNPTSASYQLDSLRRIPQVPLAQVVSPGTGVSFTGREGEGSDKGPRDLPGRPEIHGQENAPSLLEGFPSGVLLWGQERGPHSALARSLSCRLGHRVVRMQTRWA